MMVDQYYDHYNDAHEEEENLELKVISTIQESQRLIDSQDDDDDSIFLVQEQDEYPSPTPTKAHRLLRMIITIVWSLLPSLIVRREQVSTKSRSSQRLALSGLRGVACMVVFQGHYFGMYSSPGTMSWAYRYPLLTLPFAGHAAVPIFFTVSGYVLSRKPVRLMRQQQYGAMLKTLASSMLRRAPRLFLPTIAMTSIIMLLTTLGTFDRSLTLFHELGTFLSIGEAPGHETLPILLYRLWLNIKWLLSSIFPFEISTDFHGGYYTYDDHQWSIPVEMFGSMAMFGTLISLCWLRTTWRILLELSIYTYLYMTSRGRVGPFIVGLLLSEAEAAIEDHKKELKVMLPETSSDVPSIPHKSTSPEDCILGQRILKALTSLSPKTIQLTGLLSLLLGLTMVTSPTYLLPTPNFLPGVLSHIMQDPDQFLLMQGANLTILGIMTASCLDFLFTNRLALYLGDISFAIYLVHGAVKNSLGTVILPWTLRVASGGLGGSADEVVLNKEFWDGLSDFRIVGALMLGYVVVCPVVIWCSDLLWRFVDVPSVRLAKWVETRLAASPAL